MSLSAPNVLLLVDLQNDFCPGGSLAVNQGDEVIAVANDLQQYFDHVIATKDWHPRSHISFASTHSGKNPGDIILVDEIEQVLWPEHCVQESAGSDFHPKLHTAKIEKIIYKGSYHHIDSYSAFFDNEHLQATGLADYLTEKGLTTIYLMGLATDYCVKYTCLDALKLGFKVKIIEDGCRGVEINPGDIDAALCEMINAGATVIRAEQVEA